MDPNPPAVEATEAVQAVAEQQWIERAIRGDPQALDRLLKQFYQPLADHIARKVPGWLQHIIEVKDVVQETFQQAIRHIETFESRSPNGFFAWLRTIADNKLTDRLRHIGLEPTVTSNSWLDGLPRLLSALNPSPSRQAAQREAIEAIQAAIVDLPPRQQTAIHLQYVEELTIKQIAATMGCTDHAVRGLLHHAKENLRGAMGQTSKWLSKK
jgi:RNA polymerase sigma-70 factor (ECF subfamily)